MTPKEFTDLQTGFIAPNGDFHPCDYMDHINAADDVLQIYYGATGGCDPESELIDKGWIVIHLMTFIDNGYLFKFKGPLTPEQIRIIKPVVEDNMNRILKSNRTELLYEFER